MDSKEVKEIVFSLGADLCGIASDVELTPDDLKENICTNCNLCVNVCPVNALERKEINQQKCWDFAFGDNEETKNWEISCHRCRDICPYNLGTENKNLIVKS